MYFLSKKQLFFVLFSLLVSYLVLQAYYKKSSFVMIDIVGHSLDDALEKVSQLGCHLSQRKVIFSDHYKGPIVIEQFPLSGTLIKRGQIISIMIGKPSLSKKMPHLVGKKKEEIDKISEEEKLYIQCVNVSSCLQAGICFGQFPAVNAYIKDCPLVAYIAKPVVSEQSIMPALLAYSFEEVEHAMMRYEVVLRKSNYKCNKLIQYQYPQPRSFVSIKKGFIVDVG